MSQDVNFFRYRNALDVQEAAETHTLNSFFLAVIKVVVDEDEFACRTFLPYILKRKKEDED
jgi:hypothetical protein